MHHVVWLTCDLDDDVCVALEKLLRVRGSLLVVGACDRPADLVIARWEDADRVLAEVGGEEGAPAMPVAFLYLAEEGLHGTLGQQVTDPLADVLLLPVRASDVALAVARGLSRRDHYLNLGAATATDGVANEGLIGESPALTRAIEMAYRVAASSGTSVLIEGESGAGKELLARLIHDRTPRRCHRPFVDVNCAAIPTELLESELFGFERGAFTHAGRDKVGLMELAHGGTLFLDEIGELNIGLQAKLLRALESGTFRRLGGLVERHTDCRVIASTNRNLLEAVQKGLFRLDLYHRLAVFTLHVPALRERREDIMPIAEHFVRRFAPGVKKRITGFSPTARALLLGYPYPGNVRELKNIVERALIMTRGPLITPKDLGLELTIMADTVTEQPSSAVSTLLPAQTPASNGGQSLEECEREHIEDVLVQTGGNRTLAARVLRISIPTLYAKIRKYGFEEVGR